MKKAIKMLINGTVQGVFFRNFVKEEADKLDVKGFIRNLDSGNIEVFAEGEIENVDQLCKICETGPRHAKIKNVSINESPFQDFKEFKVLHI
ncbi:acylphosphatase [Candidatus Pacearchaeota archaeon]|nr:acylphosphatase [Candidatus Pacearchaeota archaeon]